MQTGRIATAMVALCALLMSVWMLPLAIASEGAREPAKPLAEMFVGANQVDWQPAGDYEHLTLTVAGPTGIWIRNEFADGLPASLGLVDQNGRQLPDGAYTYELRLVSRNEGNLPERSLLQAGSFSVRDGSFVSTSAERKAPEEAESVTEAHIQNITAATQVIAEPLVVQGGACIGESCLSTDATQYSSLKLKGEATAIGFENLFGGAGPNRDWALVANDYGGGLDHFFFLDLDALTKPFSVLGGAPDFSLAVGSSGNVGVGTSAPAKAVHLVRTDTPTLRFEDAGAFPGTRTWDVGANHTELFVKDVTNSSSVPFRIQAGAPTDSLRVSSTGQVGIGTSSPGTKLHLFDNAANVFTILQVENTGSGVNSQSTFRAVSNTAFVSLQAHGGGRTLSRFGQTLGSWAELIQSTGNGLIVGTGLDKPLILGTNSTNRLQIDSNGNIGIGTTSPAHPLQMASGAHVTAGGVWTNASSRELKHDIQSLEAGEARATLARLEPVRFRYNADPHDESLGFIAEDVPDLVATVDHKTLSPMDLVAVLTRVVQEQQDAIGDLQTTVTSLTEKLAAIEEKKVGGESR